MSQPIAPLSITSPGFFGLNTQDAPSDIDPRYALDATNCVIDRSGRISARKGWVAVNVSNVDLGTEAVESIGELIRNDGSSTIIAAGNNKIFKVSGTTLVQLTYGGGGSAPAITGDKWQMVVLNDILVMFQTGHDPLIYDPIVSTTTYRRLSEKSGATGTPQKANAAISAFGRIWCADTATDKNTVQWCDVASPHVWTGGTSGYLNLLNVWPSGGDYVVALAAHNGKLFIFGNKQTLVYSGADDPTTMALTDTLTNIGCITRDSVQNTGEDVVFLSASGVRSLSRTIQENSAPTKTVSRNVNDDIKQYVSTTNAGEIISAYSPSESFYLLTFKTSGVTYCFDTRSALQDGSYRATIWTLSPSCYCYAASGALYLGLKGYVATYSGYNDGGAQYRMSYATTWADFGNPVKISILKRIMMTLTGAQSQDVVIKWGFDYDGFSGAETVTLGAASVAQYGISEYNNAEYSSNIMLNTIKTAASGSGRMVQIGVEALLSNFPIAINRVDIYTKEGRLQ